MIPLKTTPTSTPASGTMLWGDLDHVISGRARIERNQALSYIYSERKLRPFAWQLKDALTAIRLPSHSPA